MRAILKKKRINMKLTQSQVAEQIGIKREHYTKIELGDSNPSLPVYLKLKEVLEFEDKDFENVDEDMQHAG
ncbi:helix-turn-helix transcriptional regulator [Alkalibacter mobilis]|uniref:helix-turn-helix transcriptional regulator n=1 Tax=Alkalibacter mobilis TaxID=2787712 RepID=UPI00189CFF9B|nr:helix-turn-helix transcriptional regulator [Alkalibacter mobilis]MBF7097606.1 helix-turn-helix transcriptional regulator [Alkalibacter mobilis]